MKLKVSDIILIVLAVVTLGMLGYTLSQRSGSADKAAVEEVEKEFSSDPDQLVQQLQRADRDKVLRFMREVMDEPIPDDYDFPDFLVNAGSGKESARVIGERYPEFYGLGGDALINAARRYPVRYKAMIEESKAYRVLYRHEVEGKNKPQ